MRSMTTALLIVLALVLAACGDDDTTTETSATSGTTGAPATTTSDGPIAADAASLTISGFDFGEPITVPIGTEVTITNEDSAAHTWTSRDGLWDSGNLGGGESFSHTFTDAGTYEFFCSIHPSMTGSITVTG